MDEDQAFNARLGRSGALRFVPKAALADAAIGRLWDTRE
jgi:hypothetical protein